MLKVGFVEVMQLGDGWFRELVQKDLVPARLRSWRSLDFSGEPYVNAPGCVGCDMDVSRVLHMLFQVAWAYEGAIRVAARSHRHPSTTKDHSLGLVVFLAQELGVLLPQPSYVENAVEKEILAPGGGSARRGI